jgi:polyisoprenoid-binding protein YceI
MKRLLWTSWALLPLLLLVTVALIACGGDDSPAAAPAEATVAAPTEAPPTSAPTEPPPTPTAAPAITETAAVTATAPLTESATASEASAVAGEPLVFVIDQSQSQARFLIDEVLMGTPTTVEGVTALITGTITVNPADLSQASISPIIIDARDLTTDRNMRNRALRRVILQSSRAEYQYITFTPTAIAGLPDSAQAGDSVTFTVVGDLQIRDIVQPVTFAVELTADSATQISGLAKATVTREAFDLTIPNVPGVANVAAEVFLELAFVALAQ